MGMAVVPMGAIMGGMQATPDREPIEPPNFDDYGLKCPECGANPSPWEGENVVAAHADVTILDSGVAIVVEAKCTCGFSDRSVIQ